MTVETGISVYAGLNYKQEAIQEYINLARGYGYSRIFTSLHIPEADKEKLLPEFKEMVGYAKQLGFQVTADISPEVLNSLDVRKLKHMGIAALRLDFGFNPGESIALVKRSGVEVELNASTADRQLLEGLLTAGMEPGRLRACHNFYPRPETGLSYQLFCERSRLFHQFGIPVAAFIPSGLNRRGPIYAGLPTLEQHRKLGPVTAAKHFYAGKAVETVLFGDPFAGKEELAAVAALEEDHIQLRIELMPGVSAIEKEILLQRHTNRMDPGEKVIRSQEARTLCGKRLVAKRSPLPRSRGTVTIDNEDYLRYMGELQVIREGLPPDARVNVVARVIDEELFLLDYIRPGGSFSFAY
jgi:hypothetical protein